MVKKRRPGLAMGLEYAAGADAAVAVEQVLAGDAHVVEGDAAVVDAVESDLEAAVLDGRRRAGAAVSSRMGTRKAWTPCCRCRC
jgi:hypothetical protein